MLTVSEINLTGCAYHEGDNLVTPLFPGWIVTSLQHGMTHVEDAVLQRDDGSMFEMTESRPLSGRRGGGGSHGVDERKG